MRKRKITGIIILAFAVFIVIILFRPSCENYKDAHLKIIDNKTLLVLKGKRKLMAHEPISIFIGKTYEDSISFPLPYVLDGIIEGNRIDVKKGYYKYKGNIEFKGTKLKVNLFYDNRDDKKIEPLDWNGDYNLVKE
jgi:hypothetical protein